MNQQLPVVAAIKSIKQGFQPTSGTEIKHQIEYKAALEGVIAIQLSVKETRGTSQLCPRCGKKIAKVDRRQLWCAECKRWMDRDVVAVFCPSKGWLGSPVQKGFQVKQ